MYVVYANALSSARARGSLYHFSLFEIRFVCFIKQAFLLAIVFKFGEGSSRQHFMVELCSTKSGTYFQSKNFNR
jgi:hypothetical protein